APVHARTGQPAKFGIQGFEYRAELRRIAVAGKRQQPGDVCIGHCGSPPTPSGKLAAGSRRCNATVEAALADCRVLFCTAACNRCNDSFTIDPHPDVGEGAGPQPVRPGRAFYLPVAKGASRSAVTATWPARSPDCVRCGPV